MTDNDFIRAHNQHSASRPTELCVMAAREEYDRV